MSLFHRTSSAWFVQKLTHQCYNRPYQHQNRMLKPRSFLSVQFSSQSAPSLQHCMGLLWPTGRTQHLVLLKHIQLASAQWSACPDPTVVFLLSGRSTIPPNLVSLTGGAPQPLVQIINKDITQGQPWYRLWETPLMTSCQLDLTLFTALWVQLSSQLFSFCSKCSHLYC